MTAWKNPSTKPSPSRGEPTVFVVDDDRAMLRSIEFLLASIDLQVEGFTDAQSFLDAYDPTRRGCLLTDVRMPGTSGLALLEELRRRGHELPVVVMTAYADVNMAVRAMRLGALDFIEKPWNEQELLERIQRALDEDADRRSAAERRLEIEACLETLSPRESEVLDLIVEGLLNKQIAAELGVSIKTVELHRSRVMEKMEAGNLADLVRRVMRVRMGR